MEKLIVDPASFLAVLKRLRAKDDSFAFRASGGLRIVIRNDKDDDEDDANPDWFTFEVGVVVNDEERPCVIKSIKNEVDIMEDVDVGGIAVLETFEFDQADDESLMESIEFLNAVDHWTVCPCGDYLIKDRGETCYYCQMTHRQDDTEENFCPICHEVGRNRWMITTGCCKQKMHKKCKEACIVSNDLRNLESRCPMCREPW